MKPVNFLDKDSLKSFGQTDKLVAMNYEMWGEADGNVATVLIPEDAKPEDRDEVVKALKQPELKDKFWAKTWEEACRILNEFNGWEVEEKKTTTATATYNVNGKQMTMEEYYSEYGGD